MSKIKMHFRIRGVKFDPSRKLPAIVGRAIRLLDKLPNGALFTTNDLAQEIGVLSHTLHGYSGHPMLTDYKEADPNRGRVNLWGNKRTIKVFREMK